MMMLIGKDEEAMIAIGASPSAVSHSSKWPSENIRNRKIASDD
jgi:hypothetical protein